MAGNAALDVISPLGGLIYSLLNKGGKKKNQRVAQPASYKKGGRVRKGGKAKVHKGEMKLPAKRRGKKSR